MPATVKVVTTGGQSTAYNFSPVIEVVGFDQFETGIWRNKVVQVDHGPAVFPKECVLKRVIRIANPRTADNLFPRIDRQCETGAAQRSQVDHAAVLPQKR